MKICNTTQKTNGKLNSKLYSKKKYGYKKIKLSNRCATLVVLREATFMQEVRVKKDNRAGKLSKYVWGLLMLIYIYLWMCMHYDLFINMGLGNFCCFFVACFRGLSI